MGPGPSNTNWGPGLWPGSGVRARVGGRETQIPKFYICNDLISHTWSNFHGSTNWSSQWEIFLKQVLANFEGNQKFFLSMLFEFKQKSFFWDSNFWKRTLKKNSCSWVFQTIQEIPSLAKFILNRKFDYKQQIYFRELLLRNTVCQAV